MATPQTAVYMPDDEPTDLFEGRVKSIICALARNEIGPAEAYVELFTLLLPWVRGSLRHRWVFPDNERLYAVIYEFFERITLERTQQIARALEGGAKTRTFLYACLSNLAVDHYKFRERSRIDPLTRFYNPTKFQAARQRDLEELLIESEQLQVIFEEVKRWPPLDQKIFELYVEGIPPREIARQLKLDVEWVRRKCARLMAQLRRKFGKGTE